MQDGAMRNVPINKKVVFSESYTPCGNLVFGLEMMSLFTFSDRHMICKMLKLLRPFIYLPHFPYLL
jgi:hypothetical protein